MAYRQNRIGLLAQLNPAEARKEILGVFQKSGTYDDAAAELETSVRTLHRLVASLDLADAVAEHLTHAANRPARTRDS